MLGPRGHVGKLLLVGTPPSSLGSRALPRSTLTAVSTTGAATPVRWGSAVLARSHPEIPQKFGTQAMRWQCHCVVNGLELVTHRDISLRTGNHPAAPSSSGAELPFPSTGLRRRRTKRPAQPQTSLCFRKKCAVLQASQEATVPVSMKRGESTSMAHLAASVVPRRAAGEDKHQLTNSLMSST